MLKNYFTIALRSLRKRLGTTALNVVGLAVGLACCLLISLYVLDELSYDQHHEKGDRVVRLALEPGGGRVLTVTPTIAGPILTREFPEVETYVRFTRPSEHTMRFEDRPFQREVLTYADSTVFDVFTLPFVHGTADGALTRPNTIVLTASVAQRHFGDRNPVGEMLTVDGDRTFEVTGVIEDLPPTTHLSFDAVGSFETLSWADREIWGSANFHTYLLLQSEAAIASVDRKIPGLIERELGEQTGEFKMRIALQQLPRIHLHVNGYITYVYIFGAIALLILLIACINFMNLATARSAERAKEVGVRKTLGAVRPSLVGQFLTEAVLLALIAAVLGLILAELALPAFRTLAGKALSTHVLTNPAIVGAMLGLAVVVGLAAGSYPAFVLARFRPVQVLKGSFSTGRQGSTLRKTLVVVQFAVSVALIAGTAVVFQQLDYVQSTNLGFDKEQTIVLPLEEESTFTTLKQTLGQAPGVQHVSAVSTIPGGMHGGYTAQVEGLPEDERPSVQGIICDPDVVDALGLNLLAGTGFPQSPDYDVDANGYPYVINEAMLQRVGWTPQEALGKRLNLHGREGQVVGVVEDFHQSSLHTAIQPLVLFMEPHHYNHLLVKTQTGDVRATLDAMEATWTRVVPQHPFAYRFLDDAYDALYRAEQRVGHVFGTFAGLAIFVACLGLFGLSAFTVQQRTKEIGVRKVLGATTTGLVTLLAKDFAKLVLVAFALGVPVAYFAMQRWLSDFAYRIDLGVGIFAFAGGLALLIALLTVSYHTIRAALSDPVESLRYE